jgi:16S rRNA (uracil1498-N3)-methyltransferase
MIRLFVPGKLEDGETIALGPEQSHYLRDVMRRGAGDEIELFNERDGAWRAIVAAVDRRSVSLTPRGRTRAFAPGPDLELIVAPIKRPRLESVVEKATELGVRRIRLAITRFTQGDRVKLERLQAIAVEAAEQTGRLDVPEVAAPDKLGDMLDSWGERRLIFCDEGGDARPMWEALSASEEGTSILIGPEGGFSLEERDRLRALPFVIPVSLGPRILRADTAAIAALVLWQSKLGDWSP